MGSLFGELLAAQFAFWWGNLGGGPLTIIETGAHDGTLAGDILTALGAQPGGLRELHYLIAEPSPARQGQQRERLARFGETVTWVREMSELSPVGGLEGIVFCNELLDALPFRRWRWSKPDCMWKEVGVTLGEHGFEWTLLDGRLATMEELFAGSPAAASAASYLTDGFIYDESAGATKWWGQVATLLKRGWMVAFDYGYTHDEILERSGQGTLRSYREHRLVENVLESPGEQDITGHVNFSAIIAKGAAAGLELIEFELQSRFLTRTVARLVEQNQKPWDAATKRQFQMLTHPNHLGNAFRVLVQGRGVAVGESGRA